MREMYNQKNQSDGIDFMAAILEHSIAACFFDPQYRGVMDKMNYGNEGARQKERATLTQMSDAIIRNFMAQIDRVLRPSGHLFLWIDKFHLCEGIHGWFQNTHMEIVDMITWNKQKIGMGYRTRRTSEYLVIAQKSPKRAKGVWTIHNIPDVWNEKLPPKQSKIHAHQKPLGLQKKLIEAVTEKGDIILDPAAGSFSVLAAAQETGRNFIGCDIEVKNEN